VRISALALLKMAMHAKSGGNLEIMGMLQGKIVGDTFIILGAQHTAQRRLRRSDRIAG
jgi:COP9 signalosome complex subunit 5